MNAVTTDLAGHAPERTVAAAPAAQPTGATPRISVVVPTYRRPELLLRCLLGLMEQTVGREAFEIIVVDDGHDAWPRTLVLALGAEASAPSMRYLRPLQGKGPAVARNVGWRAARGDVVAFTDDDTLPAADWLEKGEAELRRGGWAAVGGRVLVPLASRQPTDHERMTQGLERTEFVTANAFVRRIALQQVQGFDERFTRAWREDSDLQFRLMTVGPVGRAETAVVLHPVRRERWGISLRQQKNAFFEALLYAKHPQRYRQQVGLPVPWDFYAIVVLSVVALLMLSLDVMGSAVIAGTLALALDLRFAARRLRGTSHAPGHVLEMLATSLVIPFMSVWWRLRGALHFRVWFL